MKIAAVDFLGDMGFDMERIFAQTEVASAFVDDFEPKDCSQNFENHFGQVSCSFHQPFLDDESFSVGNFVPNALGPLLVDLGDLLRAVLENSSN